MEKVCLGMFLLLIPTQLGKHYWPEWSQVMGIRVDYLSVVLYLTDILWVGLVISKLSITNYPPRRAGELRIKKRMNFQNILLMIFVLVNILIAGNKGVAVYRWSRLFQWWWFYEYCKLNRKKIFLYLKGIIPCWIIVEVLLGFSQIVNGGSLEGWWYWLGERRFSLTTIGIAQMSFLGQGLIRAYGTFSHPNSLAGFLLVVTVIWMKYYNNLKFIIFNLKISGVWWWMVMWFSIIGILISGSRTVWSLMILVLVVNWWKLFKNKINLSRIIGCLAIAGGVFLIILGVVGFNYRTRDFIGGWDSESFSKRISLNLIAIKMWQDNFMLGVGNGNFIPKLSEYQTNAKYYWLQPVHNIFLLIGVETGMLGIIILIWVFRNWWNIERVRKEWLLWLIIIVTGMVDHYWISLPQNSWLLAIVMGII